MRNIKFMLTFLCLLMSILFFTVTMGFADDDDPEGFRGIKWGTNIKNLSNMSPCMPSDVWKYGYVFGLGSFGMLPIVEVKTYIRKGDNLTIGQVPLDRIEYAFWHERLIGAGIFYNKKYVKDMESQLYITFGFGYDSEYVASTNNWKTVFYKQDVANDQAVVCIMSCQSKKEIGQQIKNEEQQEINRQRQNLKQQF